MRILRYKTAAFEMTFALPDIEKAGCQVFAACGRVETKDASLRKFFSKRQPLIAAVKHGRFQRSSGSASMKEGMSTDWSRHSTPETTKLRAANPAWKGGVIGMVVGDVRKVPSQTVVHAPLPDNRAHTNVKGQKPTQARYLFMRIWRWAIEYQADGPVPSS
jgi:hypothetical protein